MPRPNGSRRICLLLAAGIASLLTVPLPAKAVPSFSRQTGSACAACHTAFPELTAYGRQFKVGGYTQIAGDEIKAQEGKHEALSIDKIPPLSFMLTGSYAVRQEKQSGTLNDDVLVPDSLSLFYAGRITPHTGAFLQVTYDPQDNHFAIDNLDLRATLESGDFVAGVTVNDSPTVEDLWNTTPAWGWPFLTSGAWPGEGSNSALVDGTLAQAAVGAGPFASWRNTVYAAAAVYRSAPLGAARPLDATNSNLIHVVAPYWRAAWQGSFAPHYLEIGTYGLAADLYPGQAASAPLSGATDGYLDVAADAQYQYTGQEIVADAHATWIYEKRHLRASAAGAKTHLNTMRADADVYWGVLGAAAGAFFKWGNRSDAWGTDSGLPDTNGALFELTYRPWQNFYLRAQYTLYFTFDGRHSDYDGAGRDAADNNTIAVLAWLAY